MEPACCEFRVKTRARRIRHAISHFFLTPYKFRLHIPLFSRDSDSSAVKSFAQNSARSRRVALFNAKKILNAVSGRGPFNCFSKRASPKDARFRNEQRCFSKRKGAGRRMADETPRPPDTDLKKDSDRGGKDATDGRSLAGLLGLGLQLALTVGAFTAVGWWGDAHWGWSPWGRQGMGFVGIVIGLYFFVKEATR